MSGELETAIILLGAGSLSGNLALAYLLVTRNWRAITERRSGS